MRGFPRTNDSNLLLLLSVAVAVMSTHAMAEQKPYADVRGWRIASDLGAKTCSAFSRSNPDRTQLGFRWDYKSASWSIALFNSTWSLKIGQRIPGRVYVDRDLLVQRRMDVLTPNLIVLPISKRNEGESAKAFDEIAEGRVLRIFWSGGTVTSFGLYGSRAALKKVAECAGGMSRLVQKRTPARSAKVASYRYEVVPREEALVFVTNIFAKAGVTRFQILPNEPNSKYRNVVYYRFADGRLGWFAASRGETPIAEKFAANVIASRIKQCDGTFASQIEKIPSTNGSIIRKLATGCAAGDSRQVTRTTIVRRPDGLLLEMSEATKVRAKLGDNQQPSTQNRLNDGNLLDEALFSVR